MQNCKELAKKISELLKELGRVDPERRVPINLPYGTFKTALHFRSKILPPLNRNQALERNLSYELIGFDVLAWLISRTDLRGIAKVMLLKLMVIIIAASTEALLRYHLRVQNDKDPQFATLIKKLKNTNLDKFISDLDKLRIMRNEVHIDRSKALNTKDVDYNKINLDSVKKAYTTFSDLCNELKAA